MAKAPTSTTTTSVSASNIDESDISQAITTIITVGIKKDADTLALKTLLDIFGTMFPKNNDTINKLKDKFNLHAVEYTGVFKKKRKLTNYTPCARDLPIPVTPMIEQNIDKLNTDDTKTQQPMDNEKSDTGINDGKKDTDTLQLPNKRTKINKPNPLSFENKSDTKKDELSKTTPNSSLINNNNLKPIEPQFTQTPSKISTQQPINKNINNNNDNSVTNINQGNNSTVIKGNSNKIKQ